MNAKSQLFIYTFALILINTQVINSKRIIWDEVLSPERLETRVKNFNDWYFGNNSPSTSKVSAKLSSTSNYERIGLYATEEIKEEEVFLKIEKSKLIKHDLIYDTKLGSFMKKLESKYGFDDYTNLLFYLLLEMNNPTSNWKPYLDLLPRQPTTLAYKFWERKEFIEAELFRTPPLSKIK